MVKKKNMSKGGTLGSAHHVWLIVGISIAVLVVMFLILYGSREAFFGKAAHVQGHFDVDCRAPFDGKIRCEFIITRNNIEGIQFTTNGLLDYSPKGDQLWAGINPGLTENVVMFVDTQPDSGSTLDMLKNPGPGPYELIFSENTVVTMRDVIVSIGGIDQCSGSCDWDNTCSVDADCLSGTCENLLCAPGSEMIPMITDDSFTTDSNGYVEFDLLSNDGSGVDWSRAEAVLEMVPDDINDFGTFSEDDVEFTLATYTFQASKFKSGVVNFRYFLRDTQEAGQTEPADVSVVINRPAIVPVDDNFNTASGNVYTNDGSTGDTVVLDGVYTGLDLNADGTFTYTGASPFTFTYHLENGGFSSDSATVTIDAQTCFDGVLNQDESDVDCGGVCGACADDKSCAASGVDVDANCLSGICSAGVCIADGGGSPSGPGAPPADSDGDGVLDSAEVEGCASNPDCDGDGVNDGDDVCKVTGILDNVMPSGCYIGDLNGNECVDNADLNTLNNNFLNNYVEASCNFALQDGDVNGDGCIDNSDLNLLNNLFLNNYILCNG